MFGSKKSKDVRLTEQEIKKLKKNMTPRQRKEFEKRQEQAKLDRFDDAVMWGLIMGEDEF